MIDAPLPPNGTPPRNPALWSAAKALETTFLSEMLKAAEVGAPRDAFGGGVGEAQFATLLVDEYARGISDRTDTGLAESIYRALARADTRT